MRSKGYGVLYATICHLCVTSKFKSDISKIISDTSSPNYTGHLQIYIRHLQICISDTSKFISGACQKLLSDTFKFVSEIHWNYMRHLQKLYRTPPSPNSDWNRSISLEGWVKYSMQLPPPDIPAGPQTMHVDQLETTLISDSRRVYPELYSFLGMFNELPSYMYESQSRTSSGFFFN